MPKISHRHNLKTKRKLRVSGALTGTAQRPRLSVSRSNAHLSLQAVDDIAGKTLVMAHDLGKTSKIKGTKTDRSVVVAKTMAEALKKAGITTVIFDRGAYRYHGRVKAVAETLRQEGIIV
ncbi:MAG TPA: 50S ribosomal protein L18 [Candidatus Pacebacteria bacterium]|nr:50S ribosomal protein L18 [Candidatus Paceibacterota bacterium]